MKLSFKYGQTIRNKLLNYTNIVKNYKGETLPCSCNDSIFKDPTLGHIITGDLSFIKNRKLRNVMNKGLTYREPPNQSKEYIMESLNQDIDSYINKKCEKPSL